MFRSRLLLLAVLIGATLSMPAEAQYKWRDKSGHVQYSDLPPPPGIAEKDILQQPAPARRSPVAPAAPVAGAASDALVTQTPVAPRADPELEARRKAAEAGAAAKQKAEDDRVAAARAANCANARNQMKALQDGMRMARTNDKGEREILDDAARAQEVRNTQTIMDSDCAR